MYLGVVAENVVKCLACSFFAGALCSFLFYCPLPVIICRNNVLTDEKLQLNDLLHGYLNQKVFIHVTAIRQKGTLPQAGKGKVAYGAVGLLH